MRSRQSQYLPSLPVYHESVPVYEIRQITFKRNIVGAIIYDSCPLTSLKPFRCVTAITDLINTQGSRSYRTQAPAFMYFCKINSIIVQSKRPPNSLENIIRSLF